MSRKAPLHSLSRLSHPLLQLQHVADFGGSSMRRAPDVPSAEHHRLWEMLSICLEVKHAPAHGVERTSQGLPHGWGSLQGCGTCGQCEGCNPDQSSVFLPITSSFSCLRLLLPIRKQQIHSLLDSFPSWINAGEPTQISWVFSMLSSLRCNYKAIKYLCECCHA